LHQDYLQRFTDLDIPGN